MVAFFLHCITLPQENVFYIIKINGSCFQKIKKEENCSVSYLLKIFAICILASAFYPLSIHLQDWPTCNKKEIPHLALRKFTKILNMLNFVLFKNWLVAIIYQLCQFLHFIERLFDDNDYYKYKQSRIMKFVFLKIACIYKQILNINKARYMYYCVKLLFFTRFFLKVSRYANIFIYLIDRLIHVNAAAFVLIYL